MKIRYNHLSGEIALTSESSTTWKNTSLHPITAVDQAVIDSLQPNEKLVWNPSDVEHPSGPGCLSKVVVPLPVPSSIANWRCKAVLATSGLLAPVESMIEALSEPQKTVVSLAWNNDGQVERNSPTVVAIAVALQLSDEQIDEMFRQAAAIKF